MILTFWIYVFLLLLLGVISAGKNRQDQDYFLASRQPSFFPVALSLLATSIGGSSLFLTALLVARHGWTGCVLELGGAVGFLVLGAFFASRVRKSGSFTLSGVLEPVFGPAARRWTATLLIAAEILWFALLLKALSEILSPAFLLPIAVLVVVFYTSIGGQWAVFRTDALQTTLLFSGLVLLLLFTGEAKTPSSHISTPVPGMWTLFTLAFLSHLAGSDIFTRVLSAKDERSATQGCYTAGLGKLLWALLMVALFTGAPKELPVLHHLRELPSFLAVLLFLVLYSALFSSLDTVLMSATTFTQKDLLRLSYRKPRGAAITFFLGISGYAVYLFSGDLVEIFRVSYSFYVGAFALPVLAAVLARKHAVRPACLPVGVLLSGGTALFYSIWAALPLSGLFTLLAFVPGGKHDLTATP